MAGDSLRAQSRRARALACVLAALWLVGCASQRFGGAAALKIKSPLPDAGLYIDGAYMGRVSEWADDGRFVRPGVHRIEIRHPDHFTRYYELALTRGDAVLLDGDLRPLLD